MPSDHPVATSDPNMLAVLIKVERYEKALALIANRKEPSAYAVCLPDCVDGPPTCACAERRAHLALLGKDVDDS